MEIKKEVLGGGMAEHDTLIFKINSIQAEYNIRLNRSPVFSANSLSIKLDYFMTHFLMLSGFIEGSLMSTYLRDFVSLIFSNWV